MPAALTTRTAALAPADTPSARSAPLQWVPLAVTALLILAVTVTAARPLRDPDTWWHLRLGAEFTGSWSLADPGQLSPLATRPWFATQWIPEVVASAFEGAFGIPGVAWLFGAALVALVLVVYATTRRESDPLPAAVATTLCVLGATASLTPRPQVVSFVLLAVSTSAWLATARDLRPRWWLVPLTWFWACSHGMWFTGVLVGAAVLVGLALERQVDRRAALRLSAVPLASVLAAALTPVGPQLLLAPLATSGMAPYVTEWAAPSFRSLAPATAMVMLCLVVLGWARRGGIRWTHMAVLVLATGWALLSVRTVALGAVMLAPLVAATLQSLLPEHRPRALSRREVGSLTATALVSLTALGIAVPTTAALPDDVPTRLDASLDKLPARTIVFNAYELGGWMTWRHQDLAPVIDGMTDAYTVDHMADYVSALGVRPGWNRFVARTGASYALLETDSALVLALRERLGWTATGEDQGYTLLRAPLD